MSNLIVPNGSKKTLLEQTAGIAVNVPAFVRLFQNNYTPVAATVAGDLTEANFSGYAAAAPAGGAVAGALDAENRAVATWNSITFTKNGATGNTIYGYYVTEMTGLLLWVERFDASIAMTVDGAFITLIPKLTAKSQNSN